MKLIKGKNASINYLAKIVEISQFRKHSNPEVTRLKCCTIDGFNIITGIDAEPGIYVYFPGGCCINSDFLSYCNLYRKGELNKNPEQTGMFEENGRVKTIKLKGELSEGFILPIVMLQNYIVSVTNHDLDYVVGTEFDMVEHEGKAFWINKKYIPKNFSRQNTSQKNDKTQAKGYDKIIENQFRFHYDTAILKRNPQLIQPNDFIHISGKLHGTSGISAYVLCKQPLNWKQKIAKWLTGEEFNRYDYVYSSRRVIKNKYYNKNVGNGYYGYDIYADADKLVRPCLSKGMSVYYEIVGYFPNGKMAQAEYDYGCVPCKNGEVFTPEKHFKVRIYRVTITNVDGVVHEFSPREVKLWCDKVGLKAVPTYYYGLAKDLYPDLNISNHWSEDFINRISNDSNFYMEQNSPDCVNKVPHEGVVIKKDDLTPNAVKVKCFKFLNREEKNLDKGVIDNEEIN